MRRSLAALLLITLAATAADGAPHEAGQQPNPDMARIFAADQTDRSGAAIDWTVVAPADARRRAETKALLDGGALTTAADYGRAAFVFQHGTTPDDFLLAHSLAVIAGLKGEPDAGFIAAATLDRYLVSIGRPQIYGTQFNGRPDGGVTQEPYDRSLISDALRRELAIKSLAEGDAYAATHHTR